jgi:hypothetical protein
MIRLCKQKSGVRIPWLHKDSLSGDALIAEADEIAERAHRGQIDKIGQPYINHPRRVAGRVVTPEAKAAALPPASGWALPLARGVPPARWRNLPGYDSASGMWICSNVVPHVAPRFQLTSRHAPVPMWLM